MDLYATIASRVFKNNYWDNTEYHEDGTPYPEGQQRRKKIKFLVIGIIYEHPIHRISDDINCTEEETQELIDNLYVAFPKIKQFNKNTDFDYSKLAKIVKT